MPCVEHLSPASYGSAIALRSPSDSNHHVRHGVLNQRSQQVEKRGLLDIVADIFTGAIKVASNTITAATDALGLTNSNPEMPPPGNGNGGNNGGGNGGGNGNGNGGGNGNGNGNGGGNGNGNGNNGNGNGNGNSSTGNNGAGQTTASTTSVNSGNDQNAGGNNTPTASSTFSSTASRPTPPESGPTAPVPTTTGAPVTLPSDQSPPPDGSQDGDIVYEVPGSTDTLGGDSGGSVTTIADGGVGDSGSYATSLGSVPYPVANAGALATAGGVSQQTVTTDANGRTITITIPPNGTGGSNQNHDGGKPSSKTRIAIGLGVAFAILLVLVGFFLLRRRRIAKRQNQRQQWWFRRRRLSKEYQDEKISSSPVPAVVDYTQRRPDSIAAIDIPLPPSTTSLSSQPSSFNVSAALPTPPPMAEIRNPLNAIDFLDNSPPPSPTNLLSVGSSDPQESSSSVVVVRRQSISTSAVAGGPRTPLSSQEPIASPEISPPVEAVIDRTSAYQFQPRSVSRSSSSSSSRGTIRTGTFETGTFESGTFESGSGLHAHPNIEISSRASSNSPDPFADDHSDPFSDPTTPIGPSFSSSSQNNNATTVTEYHRYSASSTVETDPFSVSIIASTCYGTFDEFEKVRVHFLGNLSDELSVRRGDELRILKVFEDGWALVEKACSDGSQDAERGVIPAECLRERMSRSGCAGGFDEYPRRVDSYTTSSAQFRA